MTYRPSISCRQYLQQTQKPTTTTIKNQPPPTERQLHAPFDLKPSRNGKRPSLSQGPPLSRPNPTHSFKPMDSAWRPGPLTAQTIRASERFEAEGMVSAGSGFFGLCHWWRIVEVAAVSGLGGSLTLLSLQDGKGKLLPQPQGPKALLRCLSPSFLSTTQP